MMSWWFPLFPFSVLNAIAVTSFSPGQVLNLCPERIPYRIEHLLGNGSFGSVFLATDLSMNDFVAIKGNL